jgi:hypothetical protein
LSKPLFWLLKSNKKCIIYLWDEFSVWTAAHAFLREAISTAAFRVAQYLGLKLRKKLTRAMVAQFLILSHHQRFRHASKKISPLAKTHVLSKR